MCPMARAWLWGILGQQSEQVAHRVKLFHGIGGDQISCEVLHQKIFHLVQ
jgi:hypothetical protein